MCGLLGIGGPFLTACGLSKNKRISSPPNKVIIIGAGAAGLSAAYLLNQAGIEVQVLEASDNYGGRMKRTLEFTDFPISLGAEWLHTKKEFLDKMINDPSVQLNSPTTPYNFKNDYAILEGKQISLKDLGFSIDQKFIGTSWFDFYEKYIVPSIKEKLLFKQVVNSVDYSGDQVLINTSDKSFTADKVILTVPVKLLQSKTVLFKPELPDAKKKAIEDITVWGGCKAFIEFSEQFYPSVTGFKISPETAGHKLYYDAAYGQNSKHHILGLIAVGAPSVPYRQASTSELISYMLNELDEIFDGKASAYYVKHIFQNWNKEPFANGAYVHYYEDWKNIRALGEPVANKLFFAGDAYTKGNEWSSVHSAARSAMVAVEQLIS